MIKRPLLFGVAAFVLGECFGWKPYMAMGLGIAGFLVLLFGMRCMEKEKPERRLLPAFFICMLLGLANGYRCQVPDAFRDYVKQECEGTLSTCMITGTVKRVTDTGERRSLLLKTSQIQGEGYLVTKPYLIQVYDMCEESWQVHIGNQVEAELTLKLPAEPTNPGEFNAETYYRARGITFLGYMKQGEVTDSQTGYILQKLTELRGKGEQVFSKTLPEPYAGVMNAMLLGETGGLDDTVKKLYQRSGIAHILAISGLHISILGMLLYKSLRKLGISYLVSGILVILILAGYGWMTGLSGSTVRAVLMFALLLGGDILGRTYDMLTAMGAACLCMLVENPWRLLDAGFLLSFGAVFALGGIVPIVEHTLAECEKQRENQKLVSRFRAGVILQLITGPIVVYFYYEFPVYGVLLNLVVIPLMTPLVAFGGLGLLLYPFAPAFSALILMPCGWILACFTGLCRFTQKLPGSIWHIGGIKLWQIILYYGLIIILWQILRYKNKKRMILGVSVFMAAGLLLFMKPQTGCRIIMLDVGQGDSILLETPKKQYILFDGGSSSRSRVGEYVITPALKYYGADRLDYIFVSHMDEDHINGIEELLELSMQGGIPIGTLVVSEYSLQDEACQELLTLAKQAGIDVQILCCGEVIEVNQVVIRCMAPNIGQVAAGQDKNNSSMVLSVSWQSFDMLMTGDLEVKGEQWLLQRQEDMEKAYDILKVGHHGSSGASGLEFLNRVQPKAALISCGLHNRYGHPQEETLERLADVGASVYRTDEGGAILVAVTQGNMRLHSFRSKTVIN